MSRSPTSISRGMGRAGVWVVERAPLVMLLLIAAVVGGALLALVAHFLPLYLHELANLCRRSWRVLLLHVPVLGALVPLLLLGGALLWGVGGLARQVRDTHRFLAYLRARCEPTPAALIPLVEELRLTGRLCVLRDESAFAFCYGLLRPRVCVTTGMLALLTDQEQRALLAHEGHHLHRRHPLWKLLADTLNGALRFIPLVPVLHHAHQVSQEVAADRTAIGVCGGPGPLASALVKLLQREERLVLPQGAMSIESVLDARLNRLLGGPAPLSAISARALLASGLIVFSIALGSYAAHSVMYTMPPGASECLTASVWHP